MNAPTRFMLAAFVTICLVGVVIGVSVGGRASPGLVVRLQQLKAPAGVTVAAQFAVSNSDSRIMYVIYAAPQIRSNGRWNLWTDADYHPFFCLLPGGAVTNVIVSIPHPGNDVRVPFQWGWSKPPSLIQRIAPRLTTRFSNLMITLRIFVVGMIPMVAFLNSPDSITSRMPKPVQRTGASRFAQRQIERHRRLAPPADPGISYSHRTEEN